MMSGGSCWQRAGAMRRFIVTSAGGRQLERGAVALTGVQQRAEPREQRRVPDQLLGERAYDQD
eukprot:1670810-Prymnesium_polylepis.1